jgi:hypothetical protein
MLVDEYEKYNNERQDIVDISADETTEDGAGEPMADNCTSTLLHGCHFAVSANNPQQHCQWSQRDCERIVYVQLLWILG